jgi:hypothetical protein
LRIFISLFVSENNATSAPEMVNASNNNAIKTSTRIVVLCMFMARKTKENIVWRKPMTE